MDKLTGCLSFLFIIFCSIEANSEHVISPHRREFKKAKYGPLHQLPLPTGCGTAYLTYNEPLCVPRLTRNCRTETKKIRMPVRKEETCETITLTKCDLVEVEEEEIKLCGTKYEEIEKPANIESFKIGYARRCEYVNTTICPEKSRYGNPYQGGSGPVSRQPSYGHPHVPEHVHISFFYNPKKDICEEMLKKTCFQVPIVHPVKEEMTLIFPKRQKACMTATIRRPKVECREETEEICSESLEMEDQEQKIRFCDFELDFESKDCENVEFEVPKTSCDERPPTFIDHQYE